MVNIEKILPIYKVEHGCILSMQGDLTIVWRVELPEIFTLSGSDYEAFHHALIKAIRVLPQNSIYHQMDVFRKTHYQGESRPDQSFLSAASEGFFEGRP